MYSCIVVGLRVFLNSGTLYSGTQSKVYLYSCIVVLKVRTCIPV